MSESQATKPGFLATGRGGHTADPAARCPVCGSPAWTHQGVDLTPRGSWFPVRVVLCDPQTNAAAQEP